MATRRTWRIVAAIVVIAAVIAYLAVPYVRAASLFVRAAHLGGRVEQFATEHAHTVTVMPPHMVPTRRGDVPAQFYRPDGTFTRSVLLIPGIHSMGINEPRLTALAKDLAGSGMMVMTLALPDLQHYQITTRSTDIIEDAADWMARQLDLAPDGRIGIIGISFAGGLSVVAALVWQFPLRSIPSQAATWISLSLLLLSLALFAAAGTLAQVNAADELPLQLTIYQENFVLVKDRRELPDTFKAGLNVVHFRDVAASLDPTARIREDASRTCADLHELRQRSRRQEARPCSASVPQ